LQLYIKIMYSKRCRYKLLLFLKHKNNNKNDTTIVSPLKIVIKMHTVQKNNKFPSPLNDKIEKCMRKIIVRMIPNGI